MNFSFGNNEGTPPQQEQKKTPSPLRNALLALGLVGTMTNVMASPENPESASDPSSEPTEIVVNGERLTGEGGKFSQYLYEGKYEQRSYQGSVEDLVAYVQNQDSYEEFSQSRDALTEEVFSNMRINKQYPERLGPIIESLTKWEQMAIKRNDPQSLEYAQQAHDFVDDVEQEVQTAITSIFETYGISSALQHEYDQGVDTYYAKKAQHQDLLDAQSQQQGISTEFLAAEGLLITAKDLKKSEKEMGAAYKDLVNFFKNESDYESFQRDLAPFAVMAQEIDMIKSEWEEKVASLQQPEVQTDAFAQQ